MKKDAYYFPHFSNARNDSKILRLRRIMGCEGYSIYFMLLEVLREQTDFKLPLKTIEDLEFDFHISKEKIFSVVTNFELFFISEDNFFSEKLVLNLQPYIEKSAKARESAMIRWGNVKNTLHANALPAHNERNALAMQVKESKLNETKENKKENIKFSIPTIEEIEIYFIEIEVFNKLEAEKFFNYYSSNGWMVGKNKMKDWKAAARNWKSNNSKYNTQTTKQILEPNKDIQNNPNRLKFK
jgi:hypothetical protein